MPHFFPVSKQKLRVSVMRGFALPTILIASVVMLIVLVVSVSSTSTVRTALKAQYYEQLAQVAGEAGIAYAEACLNANGGVPQWTDAAPLKPNTNCSGVELVACPTTSTNALCSVSLNNNVRSSFSIGLPKVEEPSILVVAGGGSGGGSTGGGGGAGGVVYAPSVPLKAIAYDVDVGLGGAVPGNQQPGRDGEDSSFKSGVDLSFSPIVAKAGGGGGYSANSTSGGPGRFGGSGGGGQNYYGSYASGSGVTGQGNSGGPLGSSAGSGGGGAGGAGSAGVGANIGGNGGIGVSNSISGASVYYGGGGGGGNGGIGGLGGGSNGVLLAATAATPNTGGGGGGGYNYSGGNGGAGGSGVVIISYTTGSITATGGTVTSSGTKTIHRFTTDGTFTVSAISALKTLPNTGFVEILRESNSAVWRRYDQKAAPASVVPDLCSGEAKSIYGWSNATVRSASYSIPGSAAKPIGIANGSINPGTKYFRKDFSVTSPGTYSLTVAGSDAVDWFVDGSFVTSRDSTSPASTSVSLSSGCHTIYAKATFNGIRSGNSDIIASLTKSGSSQPLVTTDASWRVSAGNTVHFSESNYYDQASWATVRDINLANTVNTGWTAVSGDAPARFISTTHNNSGGNYPASQYAFYRDGKDIEVATNTPVTVTYTCDDSCSIYLDGQQVASGVWSTVHTYQTTLTSGKHRFGVSVYNTAVGQSGFALSVKRVSDNAVLSRTDSSWTAINLWSGSNDSFVSYARDYLPNPRISPSVNAQLLVVGGGGSGGTSASSQGGGGGGGAGGLIYKATHAISQVGSYPVVVGSGGAAVAATSSLGNNGNDSLFDNVVANGGGGGGSINALADARIGGSGGGGGYRGYAVQVGAAGIASQGNKGGDVLANNNGGGGGGAGGVGGNTNSTGGSPGGSGGLGGPGLANSITGASVTYAAGGQGGAPPNGFANGAANTGNGGSGVYAAGGSGAGGSGVVIISYPTGSMVATGGTITTSGGNTIHTFTTSGTFTVISIP